MKERFSLGSYAGAVNNALAMAGRNDWVRRIWTRDYTVWKEDALHRKVIENALGWLNVAEDLQPRLGEIGVFTDAIRNKGYTTACLLGMGGSSLCPEVCADTFGTRPGYLRLQVLDTTDPGSILAAERELDLPRTLFVVASKSGETIESASLQKHFYERLRRTSGDAAGDHFVAITDRGTALEKLAAQLRFFRVFLNPADIGGRYSALSLFGLVPMSLIGVDLPRILERALAMAERCRIPGDPSANIGVRLGATLGALAREGVDKVTFQIAPEIRSLGVWLEQLIAESTGKEGVGILPVEGEPLGEPALYSGDRAFVNLEVGDRTDPDTHTKLKALEQAGHPVLSRSIEDRYDLAGEFFLWEFATAVAGAVLRIDPFDQPNVQESKNNTRRLIETYAAAGRFDEGSPIVKEGLVSVYGGAEMAGTAASPGARSLREVMDDFLRAVRDGDYVAILAYVRRSEEHSDALDRIRRELRRRFGAATTAGFGPRYLHSTGQLHKGGADKGVFVQITSVDYEDAPVPGEPYTFGTLKKAQALGDLQALREHGRRVLRLHIEGDCITGLEKIAQSI